MKLGGFRSSSRRGTEEVSPQVDRADVRDAELPLRTGIEEDELVRRDGCIHEKVRARIDRVGIDSEVPEHCGRGDEELRFGGVHLPRGARFESPHEPDGRKHSHASDDDWPRAGLKSVMKPEYGCPAELRGKLTDAGCEKLELG